MNGVSDREPIDMFWWRPNNDTWRNFGDELSAILVQTVSGRPVRWQPLIDAELVAIGSILQQFREPRTTPVSVWGAGLISPEAPPHLRQARFFAVRGEHTLARLGRLQQRGVVLGDPGLLTPMAFPQLSREEPRYRLGVLAHYVDAEDAVIRDLSHEQGVLLIDPLQTPEAVARQILSCRAVASTGLHGLVVSDAFGVPNAWMPISDRLQGGAFKFRDYYSAWSRQPAQVAPATAAALSETILRQYRPVPALAERQAALVDALQHALAE